MRNVLAHDYGAVDLAKVYVVASRHLPELLEHLGPLIASLERDLGWTNDEGPNPRRNS
jgi:uncharacterized protein with HEPN domain